MHEKVLVQNLKAIQQRSLLIRTHFLQLHVEAYTPNYHYQDVLTLSYYPSFFVHNTWQYPHRANVR